MAFIDVGSGNDLIISIPTKRTINWADQLRSDCFLRIAEHDHSGNGKGRPVQGAGIANDGINDTKIRLRNNQWLRGRNSSDNADINIIKVNASNNLELGTVVNEPDLANPVIVPVASDPLSPTEGMLQTSDGTHRAQGLWQYQAGNWVNIQGEVGPNSVNTAAIQDNAVTTDKLNSNSVTTSKIVDANVTTAKIADGAVTNAKLSGPILLSNIDNLGYTTTVSVSTGSSSISSSTPFQTGIITINSTYTSGGLPGNTVLTLSLAPKSGAILFIKNAENSVGSVSISGVGSSTILPGEERILQWNGTNYVNIRLNPTTYQEYHVVSVAGPDLRGKGPLHILNVTAATGTPAIRAVPGQILRLWKATTGSVTVSITVDGSTGASVTVNADSIRTVHVRDTSIILEPNVAETQVNYA